MSERYPPTKTRLNVLFQKEQRLQVLEDILILQPMCVKFGEALATICLNTPRDKWPDMAHEAFEHVFGQYEVTKEMYLSKLPKE